MNSDAAAALGFSGEENLAPPPVFHVDEMHKALLEPEEEKSASITDMRTKAKETIPVPSQGASGTWEKSKVGMKLPSGMELFGGLEAGASLLSSAAAAPAGAVAGIYRGLTGGKYGTAEGAQEAQERAAEVSGAMTYQPRSQSGRNALEAFSGALETSKIQGMGPTEAIALGGAGTKPNLKVVPKRGEPVLTSIPQMVDGRAEPSIRSTPRMAEPQREPVLSTTPKLAPETGASIGASGVAPIDQARAMAANATPELREKIEKVGQNIDLDVLERHLIGDSLPVPIRLTKGEVTRDAQRISMERNERSQVPGAPEFFNKRNAALIENTNKIREAAAPDVYATTTPEIGQLGINGYVTKDVAKIAETSRLYKNLLDANGGAFPLDSKAFVDSADAALHKNLLYDHVPPEVRRTMDRVRENGMTFENFESMRTNLARIQRSNMDGNAKAAAAIIRQSLEELPMPQGAEHLKPLADAARTSARERFLAIENDPAYKAVVTGKASPDTFMNKFVINGSLRDVQTMKQNLAHDPVAQQAMAVGTMNHLKTAAKIVENTGNFAEAGYNNAAEKLRPKLGVIFEPEQAAHIQNLGRVARDAQLQPVGSFVNNSNTALALAAKYGADTAEKMVNFQFLGIPLGSLARKGIEKVMQGSTLKEMTEVGAGLKRKVAK